MNRPPCLSNVGLSRSVLDRELYAGSVHTSERCVRQAHSGGRVSPCHAALICSTCQWSCLSNLSAEDADESKLIIREETMSALANSIPIVAMTEAADRRRRIIAIVGASSGNLVEWYDFYAYAFTSIYFASAFFPSGDATSQLLATAGIFAVGFFMRPLGGWLFGWIADTHGRRTSMIISVLMMCAGSLMIAIMPTFETIGGWAPVLLLIARLTQGLSVGGEYGTAATYMSEVASKGNLGLLFFLPVRDADRGPAAGPVSACGPADVADDRGA